MGRFIIDPLEQFTIIIFFYSSKYSTCASTNLFFSFIIIGLLFFFIFYNSYILALFNWVNILIQVVFSSSLLFISERISLRTNIFSLYFMFNFITILLLNIFGMFVFTFTVTSHLSLTFFIALSYFIGSNIVGVFYQFQLFFNLFLPKSLPVLLTPLLFFLEVVSYLSRVFSLAIRLFANMLSGHALMKILGGIAWNLIVSLNILTIIVSILPLLVIICIVGLEFTIACLQAYVFFILTVIYTNDFFTVSH